MWKIIFSIALTFSSAALTQERRSDAGLVCADPALPPGSSITGETSAVRGVTSLGIPFTAAAFQKAATDGDIAVLQAFFRAGFSPNRMSPNTPYFQSTAVINNNTSNRLEVLEVFVKCGLDFSLRRTDSLDAASLGRPSSGPQSVVTQEEELFLAAARRNDGPTLVPGLVKLGANPASLLALYNGGKPSIPLKAYILPTLKTLASLTGAQEPLVSTAVAPPFGVRGIVTGQTGDQVQAAADEARLKVRRFNVSNRPGVVALELKDMTAQKIYSESDRMKALADGLGANAPGANSGLVMVAFLSAATKKVMQIEVRNAADDPTESDRREDATALAAKPGSKVKSQPLSSFW